MRNAARTSVRLKSLAVVIRYDLRGFGPAGEIVRQLRSKIELDLFHKLQKTSRSRRRRFVAPPIRPLQPNCVSPLVVQLSLVATGQPPRELSAEQA